MSYVYIYNDGQYSVGFFHPIEGWTAESDHPTAEQAAARIHYLNGGSISQEIEEMKAWLANYKEINDQQAQSFKDQRDKAEKKLEIALFALNEISTVHHSSAGIALKALADMRKVG